MQAVLKRLMSMVPDVGAVVARFTVPVITMTVFTGIWIFLGFSSGNDVLRLLAGLVIGGYLCVSFTLASEAKDKKPNLLLQAIIVLATAALGFFSEALKINLFMAVGASVLLLGNAVIWSAKRDDLHVWDFTHKLWTAALFATAGSILYVLGMLAIQEALKSLFGLNIRELVSDILMPIGMGFLAPLYWMSSLPPVNEDYSELYESPSFVSKAIAFLGTWLLAPLTLIYALILLAYGLKIVIAGELPNGQIAGLTAPFLIAGSLTWLLLDPPFVQTKALAKLFRKVWWIASIPAACLLAISTVVRIAEYGMTPERIALVLLVIWALLMGFWFGFAAKDKRDIRYIPGAAAGLLAFGALTAGWISQFNQAQRFETGLYASGIMSPAGVIADEPVITDRDAALRARGAFDYLVRFDGRNRIADILKQTSINYDPEKVEEGTSHKSGRFAPEQAETVRVLKALGLDRVKSNDRKRNAITYNGYAKLIQVAGYDHWHGEFYFYTRLSDKKYSIGKNEVLSIKSLADTVFITIGGETVEFKPLSWIDEQGFSAGEVELETPYVTLLDREDVGVSIFVDSFNRYDRRLDSGVQSELSMNFYVLTRGFKTTVPSTP